MGKSFALILILIMVVSSLSLIMIRPASAQQSITPAPTVPIPTPSVPQFTISLAGPPFVVNTTYSLDPNTGKIVANIGYTNPYTAVVLTIKNQPFDSAYGSLYYNVRIENKNEGVYTGWEVVYWPSGKDPEQTTDSDYTNISFGVEGHPTPSLAGIQTSFQVQAMLGTYSIFGSTFPFVGVTSDWSNTETISVPANVPLSPTPAPSSSTSPLAPTETPTSTAASSSLISFLLLISTIVIAILLAVIIALLLLMRKRKTADLSQ